MLVNNPPDIGNASQMDYFKAMVKEYETLYRATGNGSTTLWLTDYEQFYLENEELMNAFGMEKSFNMDDTGMDYELLPEFLDSPYYKHWSSFIKWKRAK